MPQSGVPDVTNEPDIRTVAVVGLGTMGSGISWLAARVGCSVRTVDGDADLTAGAMSRLRDRMTEAAAAGLIDSDELPYLGAITPAASIGDAVSGADLVIEAVSEDRIIKRKVLGEIADAARDAVIATNTSSFPIDELADAVNSPERFLGAHFFNPAEWIPGVEVIPHAGTSDAAVQAVWRFLIRAEKAPAIVSSSPGFIANRLQFALFKEAARCVEEGLASAESIDTVVRSTFGFRLAGYGPFEIADMAGLDVYANIFGTLEAGLGERYEAPKSLLDLVEQGRYGLKSSRGFRRYDEEETRRLVTKRDSTYAAIHQAVYESDSGSD